MLKNIILSLVSVFICTIALIHTPAFAAPPSCTNYPNGTAEYEACMKEKDKDTPNDAKQSNSTFSGRCETFLGLTSWDCGVNINDEASLKTGIWQIVANIATDITVVAAYLVLGYVIYGGYLYIFSTGDANKVASGKKTLSQAFIGLAIVMSAYLIISTIRFALLGASGTLSNCATTECVKANDLITNAISWIIGIAGAVALIFVVHGGIAYATSSGDANKLQKAKQTILYALIGLIIVALAEAIAAFVSGIIRNADSASSSINQTIISKELHEIKNI